MRLICYLFFLVFLIFAPAVTSLLRWCNSFDHIRQNQSKTVARAWTIDLSSMNEYVFYMKSTTFDLHSCQKHHFLQIFGGSWNILERTHRKQHFQNRQHFMFNRSKDQNLYIYTFFFVCIAFVLFGHKLQYRRCKCETSRRKSS